MAESVIQKAGKAAFLVKSYAGKYSLDVNEAKGIHGSNVGYNSVPSGYAAVAFKHVDTNNNSTAFRYMQANGWSSQTLLVIRNFSANAISNADIKVEILFVRSDLIGS